MEHLDLCLDPDYNRTGKVGETVSVCLCEYKIFNIINTNIKQQQWVL